MHSLIEKALANRVAANLLAALILFVGFMSASQLNMRLFPKVTLYSIAITVPYPGATPQEVETSIVKPIEERLDGMEGITKITALAGAGVASVVVDIDESESIADMKDDIQTEIDRITVFPQRAEEPQIVHSETEVLAARLLLYGDVDAVTLKKLAERVRQDLTDRDGISRVNIGGVAPYLIDIAIAPETMQSLGLSLVDISERIGRESQDLSGGDIESDAQKLLLRATGERRTGSEFDDVVVSSGRLGSPVLLGDIATISDGVSEQPSIARYRGQPAVVLSVIRIGDEKLPDLVRNVRDYMQADLPAILPENIKSEFWRDESVQLNDRIDLLMENAAIGLTLVLLLLMAFLDIRIAAWVAFGVSISFIGAFALMSYFNVTINQLSLFGFILALGIVVDDAIVVGENMHGTWRKQGGSPKDAARTGTLQVATPVLFSVSTTMVAFVPLLIIPGTFGQFMAPIASVVIFVLLLSLCDSFFILPHHLAHLRSEKPRPWSPRRIADPFRNWFASRLRRFTNTRMRGLVGFSVRNPLAVVMICFGLFFAAMTAMTSGYVKFQVFPQVQGDFVTAELELSESASQAVTRRQAAAIAAAAERAGQRFDMPDSPAVEGVLWSMGTKLGQERGQALPEGGAAANRASIIVRIQKAATRQFEATEFADAWRAEVGQIAGAEKLTFNADLVSPTAPIQLEISTRDPSETRAAVAAIESALKSQAGVYNVSDDRFRTSDEVRISIKPLARSYGLNQEQLARQVRAAFFGAEATRVQRDREEIQVRVRLPKDDRLNLEAIKSLRIRVGDRFIPISQLAEIDIAPAPANINRVNGRRIYKIEAYVRTDQITADAAVGYITDEVLPREQANFDGLTLTQSGNQKEMEKAMPAMELYFMLAMLVIYCLLALNFKSYSQPIVVMLAIPFGFMGAVLGHVFMGMNLSLLSMFGVIGLSGVIINNSLMVISFLNDRLRAGETIEDAVTDAMLDRFRAILLTTLTTFLGVTPIILETSLQAQFLVPTAVSLGFGIIIGTTMLTISLPALAMLHLRLFGRPDVEDGAAGDSEQPPAGFQLALQPQQAAE